MADADDVDWLEGLDGDARAERMELLEWLEEQGFSKEQLRQGHQDGLLPFLPAERVIMGGPPTRTQRELAEASGADLDLLQRARRVQGLSVPDPDARVFAESESGIAGLPAVFEELGFTQEQMLGITRVLGRGLAQAAQTMRAAALEATLEPGRSERDLAEDYAKKVERVMPYLPGLLEVLLRQHLRDMVRTEGIEASERLTGQRVGARQVTIAFADLVGFTRLGEAVEPDELSRVADQLSQVASDVVDGPVRFVKQLGDGVMLVAPDPDRLLTACFALADAAAERELPELRIGLACGPATQRGGDWFGRPVNLASRVSSLARAGSTLATQEVRDAIGDELADWSFAGEKKVKGVKAPVKLWRARRPAAGP